MLRSKLSRLLFSSCRYSANALARSGDTGREQFDPQLRLPQPAGRIQPRGERKADVFAGQRRLLIELRQLHQRGQPGRRTMLQALQSVMDQNAIFVDQRHDIGHGADRRQSHRLQQERPHRIADALRLAGPLAQRPRQFERHARAAQSGERILMPRQPRMHDRGRLGQGRPPFRDDR